MSKTLSVMTYNVHSCIGMDGKVSPLRIAEVIAKYDPDIVALQELDAGLTRTALVDQAHLIAATLEMSYHFHSSIQVEEGEYGNAILSRYPLHLVKAGALPTHPSRENLEKRGAIWGEVTADHLKIQVIGTHFGLNRHERLEQVDAVMGREWLDHSLCKPPVILCGDFNSLPGSEVYRRITAKMQDVQRLADGLPRSTWPVRFSFMRIDHLFISHGLTVEKCIVPKCSLARVASDHLPLLATLTWEN